MVYHHRVGLGLSPSRAFVNNVRRPGTLFLFCFHVQVRLSRLRAACAEAAGGGAVPADLVKGLEVLRVAAAAVAGPPPLCSGSSVAAVATSGAMLQSAPSGLSGARASGGGSEVDDLDKSTFVYGIMAVVVTSSLLKVR